LCSVIKLAMTGVKLWVHEPIQLVKHPTLIPDTRMCNEELINTFTRIVLVIAIVFIVVTCLTGFIGYVASLCFLILGLIVIGVIGVLVCHSDEPKPTRIEHFRHRTRAPVISHRLRSQVNKSAPTMKEPRRHQRYPRR